MKRRMIADSMTRRLFLLSVATVPAVKPHTALKPLAVTLRADTGYYEALLETRIRDLSCKSYAANLESQQMAFWNDVVGPWQQKFAEKRATA